MTSNELLFGVCDDCGCVRSRMGDEIVCRHCLKEEWEATEYEWHLDGLRSDVVRQAVVDSGLWTTLDSKAAEADVEVYVDDVQLAELDRINSAVDYGETFLDKTPDSEMFCLATVGIQHDETVMGVTTLAKAIGWE